MDKLKMHSLDGVRRNIDLIGRLFPNAITEVIRDGKVERVVDFDVLRQELSGEIVEGREERYQFTWPDKKRAMTAVKAAVAATLRPDIGSSADFENTENLYIEGDNLDVLKLLQETYLGAVKMIYIDPPYNTGNDFVFSDDFAEDCESYLPESGQFDAEGNLLVQNPESNGRFHTDWLNMIYPRLRLARDLLSEDGTIFISIDDNELDNLSKVCEEIYGENNFVCKFIWKSKLGKVGTTSTISAVHEYILCYARNIEKLEFKMIENTSYGRKENLRQWGVADRREDRPSMYYPIHIDGVDVLPVKEDGSEGRWRVGQDMAKRLLANGELELSENNGRYNIYRCFPSGVSCTPYDTLLLDNIGTTAKGAAMLKSLDMNKLFDYSKPVELVRHLAYLCTKDNDIVLDFFSGSATTAQAVMQLNAEDGGCRRFIMVQVREQTDERSQAWKAGFSNICEIGKERIRRAAEKIKKQYPDAVLDGGFRVLKLDSSNMRDVYYNPVEIEQKILDYLVDNIKPDRTPLDLLFQVMLDLGVLLSSKIREMTIEGKSVFDVADGYLIACFDLGVTAGAVKEIAKRKPRYAVFRDCSMADDNVAVNFEQIFETYSPTTIRKVL